MVPRSVTEGAQPVDQVELVLRRVGPRPGVAAPGDRITGLAADNHFAGALLSLWHTVARAGGAVGFDPGAPRSEFAGAVTAAVNGLRDGSRFAVALTASNTLVAVGFLVPRTTPVHRHIGEIRSVMVDPGHQGRGVGPLLVAELTVLAAELDLSSVVLSARGDERWERFYRRLGFVEYGRLPGAVRLSDGRAFDEVLFQRDVTSAT